jgi:transposase-like protein
VYPQTVVQTCIVHLIRNSLAFVSWKNRRAILPAIKAIYRAENVDMALVRLEKFEAKWGMRTRRSARPGAAASDVATLVLLFAAALFSFGVVRFQRSISH